ncbi:MAG: FAD-dependent oxidoreductase [Pseudomonadales bacterium]
MKKWECIVCGWVYDEAKGWPEDGIEPGTRWEDVPEDWLCPDCGVGKEDFEMIEVSETSDAPHHEEEEPVDIARPVVIIGTGLAGYNLAREFRKHDQDTQLILITSDDGRSYSKPMLSTGYTKNTTADDLAMADAGKMALQLKASVWTFAHLTHIDTVKQEIKVGESTSVSYSKLVLAWGADVIRPPLEGDGLELVYSVNDLLDYSDFRTAVKKSEAKKLLIIGSGLIGSEFTNDLANGGFEIEAVDPLGYSLPTLLPEVAGKAVQAALESMGATFHFGRLVKAINRNPEGGVIGVLDDGSEIKADLAVSAVGVRPRIELAQAAGISCNRGIVADKLLQTSAQNVYTLGDCAEVEGHVLFYVAPLMAAARALGKTLAGEPTEVAYPAMPVTIKTPACPVVVSPPPRDAAGDWTIDANGDDVVAEFKDPSGQLLGFALTGATGIKEKLRLQKMLPPLF